MFDLCSVTQLIWLSLQERGGLCLWENNVTSQDRGLVQPVFLLTGLGSDKSRIKYAMTDIKKEEWLTPYQQTKCNFINQAHKFPTMLTNLNKMFHFAIHFFILFILFTLNLQQFKWSHFRPFIFFFILFF